MAAPVASSARACAPSSPVPPRNVESRRLAPEGERRATNASEDPFQLVSYAPGVVGKSVETVEPATVAAPEPSRARANAGSRSAPPRNGEEERPAPRKASR